MNKVSDQELLNLLTIHLHFHWLQFQNNKITELQYSREQDKIYGEMAELEAEIGDDLSEALYELAGIDSYHQICPSGDIFTFVSNFEEMYRHWKIMQ